jgi:hypothetical protein
MATNQIPGKQNKKVPVALTESQIKSIVDEIEVFGVGKEAVNLSKKYLSTRLRKYLKTINLVPEAYNEFKEKVIESMHRAFIQAGMPIGYLTGVSLAAPITQMNLNTFHFTGIQSGIALSFQRIKEILTGSKTNRKPQMKIFFKDPINYSDIYEVKHVGSKKSIFDQRHEIESTLVSDLVLDYTFLNKDDAIEARIPELINLFAEINPRLFNDSENKYQLTTVLMLKLDTYRMYTHKIVMADVARAIEGTESVGPVACIWRSQVTGIMYVIVNESQLEFSDIVEGNLYATMFFQYSLIPKFPDWLVKGISDIVDIYPQKVNVMDGISEVVKSNSKPGYSYVYTTHYKTRWLGISLADIRELLDAGGYQPARITESNKKGLYLFIKYSGNNLVDDLTKKISSARSVPKPQRNLEQRRLITASRFYTVITNGSNLEEIIWRDDVDVYNTSSTFSHEINTLLGIDAARTFLINRFKSMLQEISSSIDERHITVVFDMLCNLGLVNSLSFTGINRRKVGPLTMASFERSIEVFVNSGVFGEKEAISGVSTNLYMGQVSMRIGTGSVSAEALGKPKAPPPLPSVIPEDNPEWQNPPSSMSGMSIQEVSFDVPDPPVKSLTAPKLTTVPENPDTARIVADNSLPPTPIGLVPNATYSPVPFTALVSSLNKALIGSNIQVETVYNAKPAASELEASGPVIDLVDEEITGATTKITNQ